MPKKCLKSRENQPKIQQQENVKICENKHEIREKKPKNREKQSKF